MLYKFDDNTVVNINHLKYAYVDQDDDLICVIFYFTLEDYVYSEPDTREILEQKLEDMANASWNV